LACNVFRYLFILAEPWIVVEITIKSDIWNFILSTNVLLIFTSYYFLYCGTYCAHKHTCLFFSFYIPLYVRNVDQLPNWLVFIPTTLEISVLGLW